jgi:hypothetical protein
MRSEETKAPNYTALEELRYLGSAQKCLSSYNS